MAFRAPVFKDGSKPSLGDGLHFMRKSASHEPLGKDDSPSSDADSRGGGIEYKSACDALSPTPKAWKSHQKPTSEDGTPQSANSSFMVGSSLGDDVFAMGSEDDTGMRKSDNDAQLRLYGNTPVKVDAQGIYPGTACMFVANLSQPYDDQTLELEVTKAFSQYGKVWVKIKRDSNQMPFAFCQFTTEDNAKTAERLGKGMTILGRPCRTEMARAQSSFIVYKLKGEPTNLREAADLLSQLGEVAKAEYLDEDTQISLGLAQAVVITYKMYDSRREPVRHFTQHKAFRVVANDPKRFSGSRDAVSAPQKFTQGRNLMEQYDKDRRSAFVGNLPLTMTEDVLRSLAGSCGQVVDVHLYKKLIPGSNGLKNCFAFVEFIRPDAADDLARALNNTDIEGYRIRVERKHSRTFETPRRALPPGAHLRRVHSTIPRRHASGYFEMNHMVDSNLHSPTGHMGNPSHNMTYCARSSSYGRGRRARPTILGPDTSVGQAISAFKSLKVADEMETPAVERKETQHKSSSPSSSSTKKSVEFDLPHGSPSESPSQGEPNGSKSVTKPKTPRERSNKDVSTSKIQEQSGSNVAAAHSQPTPVAWMPGYTPYGYTYMGTPMTPQGHPGMIYGGYMASSYYTPMYDMMGNLIMSPTPMMTPYATGPRPASVEDGENHPPPTPTTQ